jgi:hypothetical protein
MKMGRPGLRNAAEVCNHLPELGVGSSDTLPRGGLDSDFTQVAANYVDLSNVR